MPKLHSSKKHRNANRTNAAAEILSAGLRWISPAAAIPGKLAQSVNSGFMLFKVDTKPSEKIAHGVMAVVSGAQVCLLAAAMYSEQNCSQFKGNLCKTILLSDLLYQGMLMLGWVGSEFFKETEEPYTDSPSASERGSPPGTPVGP